MAGTTQSRPHSSQGAPETPARPSVRDFTGGVSGMAIEWDVRTAYDFIFSLWAESGTTDDLPAEDRKWLKDARASVGPEASRKLERISRDEGLIHMAALLVSRRAVKNAAEAVIAIRSASPAELVRSAFCEVPAKDAALVATLEAAIAGDDAALEEFRSRTFEGRTDPRIGLLEDPAGTHRALVEALEIWAVPFATIEKRVAGILRRDVELRAEDRAALPGPEIVERTTGGVRMLPDPTVRRVILAPSYFSRPYNLLLAGPDWRFFAYPVADAALELDPLAPPPGVLRFHRALGDGTRLRILRLLSEKDLYPTEIAGLLT